MTPNRSEASSANPSFNRSIYLLLLFAASGCAALIYEVVWFQLLRQIIGSSSVSLAIVLSSFMGGLCIGSLAFPYRVSPARHPLLVYAYLEAGIAAIGLALLAVLPLVRSVYVAAVGYGHAGLALRAGLCLLCLLPPTVLMGATLPAISRWLQATRTGVARLGLFYMANIAGGVVGCLLAGFYLLRLFDVVVATFFAVSLNVSIAALSWMLAARTEFPAREALERTRPGLATHRILYAVIALSGLTALGAQVVWTRLLSLVFGATVYAFTVILAVFLCGLGIGSSFGSVLVRHLRRPGLALAWCQVGLVAAIPLGAYLISEELPFWQTNPVFLENLAQRYLHDLLRGAVAMLPATCLWGASFPLALAAAADEKQDPGHLVGGMYAANTVGAIAGALLFGTLLIPTIGTRNAQLVLTLAAGVAAALLLGQALVSRTSAAAADPGPTPAAHLRARARIIGFAILLVAFVALMAWALPPRRDGLLAFGRHVTMWRKVEAYQYVAEGATAPVAVTDYPTFPKGQVRMLNVGGKIVASNDVDDMRNQRLLGHLPALFHPRPRSALVVGLGTGVTAGSLILYPEIERIVICEIEPLVAEASRYFAHENYDVLNDPRVELVFDDARHFIQTTREKFDVVTSDPINPWMEGAATLYSSEYYGLVKQRLEPGGVVAQWASLRETDEPSLKSVIATFMKAFPDGTLWTTNLRGSGFDLVQIGTTDRLRIDVQRLADRLAANPQIAESLGGVQIDSVVRLLASYAGSGPQLAPWLEDAQINRDRTLRLQYLAGHALDLDQAKQLHESVLRYRSYPADLFIAPSWVRYRIEGML